MKRVNWVYCLISGLVLAFNSAFAADTALVTQAQAQLSPLGFPQESITVSLPHRWDKAFSSVGGRARYTIDLPNVEKNALMGLFIPRVGNQVEIKLNGRLLAKLGQLDVGNTDSAKNPVWVDIPDTLLNQVTSGTNQLSIETSIQAGRWGGLSSFEFGAQALLKPKFEANQRGRGQLSMLICLSFLLMGSIVLALWLRQRDPLYLLFLFVALCGAVRTSDKLLTSPPLDWPLWGIIMASALGLIVVAMVGFSLRLLQRLTMPMQRLLWGYAVWTVVCASCALGLPSPNIWTVCLASYIPLGLWVIWHAYQVQTQLKTGYNWLLIPAALLVEILGIRDFWVVRVSESGMDTFSYLPAVMFVFVVIMGGIIVNRYARHLNETQRLTMHLTEEIHQKEMQIRLAYDTLSQQNQERATLLERQRLMTDIHDGVGAHLVGLVNQTQQASMNQSVLRDQANTALDELRMTVDALQPSEGDLRLVLATLRYRLTPRLTACGIQFNWAVQALPVVTHLDAHHVLQIQRIVYQAVTNIIEHAQASSITIAGVQIDDTISISIIDNGRGFDATSTPSGGIGIASMYQRARDIDASLSIHSSAGQTSVVLIIPIRLH